MTETYPRTGSMPMRKPFSQACENNKQPILAVLRRVFTQPGQILEIGAGTGQHAVHFAANLPHLAWQPSDQAVNLPGARLWIEEAGLDNVSAPIELDVLKTPWPIADADGVFSANTAHIMHWPAVRAMFAGVSRLLKSNACFCLYGPFKYSGRHTSDSNVRFDRYLQSQDPGMGVRDVSDLEELAADHEFELASDHAMPANNRMLVWRRW
jgi:SAM-dependent methyltransferase